MISDVFKTFADLDLAWGLTVNDDEFEPPAPIESTEEYLGY